MIRRILVLLFIISLTSTISAQKVGLVLSGGGSKGVAHIGVIKALEENGIPIDYVAGTSMGAIIGGLYAAGYSPEEMQELVLSEEFSEWVASDISEDFRYYFKSMDNEANRFTLRYDLSLEKEKRNISIPVNLLKPYQMDFAIMETFGPAQAAARRDFDNLFVPFRCVAADVANNKAKILSGGDLGKSIRASMSFPFYFKPIRIDSSLVFDGGMYNNFPKDVMKEDFNPDYIIGSKVASNYGPPKVDDIISQLQTMLMENTDYEVDSTEGILVDPDIPPTNITDFSSTNKFIDKGYQSTLLMIDSIRLKVKRNVPQDELIKKRDVFNKKKVPLRIGEVIPKGINNSEKKFIINALRHRVLPGSSIDLFKEEYFKLVADQRINYIFPTAKFNSFTGLYDIILEVEKVEQLEVTPKGHISSNAINQAFVRVNYNHLGQPTYSAFAQSHIGRYYTAAHTGIRLDNSKGFPFYVRGALSFNQWDYFETSTYFFEDNEPSYLIQDDNYFALDMGIPAGLSGIVSLGVASGKVDNEYYQENNFTRTDTADRTEFDYLTHYLKYEFNTLNRGKYATKGRLLIAKLQLVNGEEHYVSGSTAPSEFEKYMRHRWWAMKFKFRHYFPDNFLSRWGIHFEAIYSNQSNFTNYTSSALAAPAFNPFPKSETSFFPRYRNYSYAALGIINVTSLNSFTDIRLEGYAYSPYKVLSQEGFGVEEKGKIFSQRYYLATGALVFHSPLGPVSLSMNYVGKAEERFSVMFSIGYLLFNRQPLKW
ncbi:MAG TPA: patatin-like phospholipase family protein [Bacteroidales bacterium]|nr:patatin-like phospholipase family protein [Bacteroidales bacterium]